MLCQQCQKRPATVHFTKIVNNHKTELYLCEECARQKGDFKVFVPFSINDLLTGFLDMDKTAVPIESEGLLRCKTCGMDFMQFRKIGRLGCQDCYKYFAEELTPVIKRVQGGIKHNGKVPRRAGVGLRLERQIQHLKAQLQKAIETEAFEEAARLRDQIRELERQLGQL